jgi:hypothetical protein
VTFATDDAPRVVPPAATPPRASRPLLVAGVLQLVALLAPAARVRLVGSISFLRLPNAAPVLAALGALAIAAALRPRGWWRWLPGPLSAAVLAVVYWRLVRAPSATFVDPVLRHAVSPSWGFLPMCVAVMLAIVGAAAARR